MVHLNADSIVGCIAFLDQLSLNGIVGTESNLMPNLEVPRCIIHKYATTIKHILRISASL